MDAYIKAFAYYLPSEKVTNEDLVNEFPQWSADKILSKVGVNERHIAASDETSADLAVCAAQKLFSEHSVDKSAIDFILFCTQSPDYFLPTSACLIQDRLGLAKSCGALDFNLGCSGFVYGLSLAKGLVVSGTAHNVLLLTAETYSKYIHPSDKGCRTIFGDGAAATLISSDGFARIGSFSLGTDGSGANNLTVKGGAMRHRDPLNDLHFDSSGDPVSGDYLYMNGGEIFNFAADMVPWSVEDALNKNDLALSDIDLFVFHQANKYMINYLRKELEIDKDRFFVFLEDVGNTVSSSIPIALCEAQNQGRLKGNVLLSGFGVGYSWGSVIILIK